MLKKSFAISFFLLIVLQISLDGSESKKLEEQEAYLQSLASLNYYTQQWENELRARKEIISASETVPKLPRIELDNKISFSEDEISILWSKAAHYIYQPYKATSKELLSFEKALQLYNQSKEALVGGDTAKAEMTAGKAHRRLAVLWENACESELNHDYPLNNPVILINAQSRNNLDAFPNTHSHAKKKILPHLLPSGHPMEKKLDAIFSETRVTTNEQTFKEAGFKTISVRPRSFVHVAKHPHLPGYLIKANLDNELRKKRQQDSWEWFVNRCVGAKKVRQIINHKNIKHFVVANKWIYPLPTYPKPPEGPYRQHIAVLLVTDMKLAPDNENYKAWKHVITDEHLNELYAIISRAKGSSYRPDNIAYTENGQFAFIDTEYPTGGPDYKSIRRYLNREMRNYWDDLVKHGGH